MAGWNLNLGFIPRTFEEIMLEGLDLINEQTGSTYTPETFVGSNLYRMYYAVYQLALRDDIQVSLVFEKLKNFYIDTNQRIINPVTTDNALIQALEDAGYTASVRKNTVPQAGQLATCVDLSNVASSDYDDSVSEIADIILAHSFAGCAYVGDVYVTGKILSNGQEVPGGIKFREPEEISVLLRLTIIPSKNTNVVIDLEDTIKDKLLTNLSNLYRLGRNFYPEKYFEIVRDAEYAGDILLEYSEDNGSNWSSDPRELQYYQVFRYSASGIEIVFEGI